MILRRLNLWITILVLLTSCTSYTSEKAKKNGDIIDSGPGGPLNTEKIIQFMNDVDQHQSSKLRVTRFTIEGDPIISDLHYDGKTILYSYDTSHDKHGGKSKGKSKTSCDKLAKQETFNADIHGKGIQYFLTGCEKVIGESHENEINVLFVPENAAHKELSIEEGAE